MDDFDLKISDKRRVTAMGAIKDPAPPSLPALPYRRFRDAAAKAWRHVDTHLDRGVRQGSLQPFLTWFHVRGLALSARQTYDAIAMLLAERNRPATMPLQAAILTRSLLEALGNVLALTSRPTAIKWFLADGYRERARQLDVRRRLFGDSERWTEWLEGTKEALDREGDMARVSRRRRRRPGQIPDWPSPYWLTRSHRVRGRRRPLPVLVRGSRARLFEWAYDLWYSMLSSYAHQRAGAAQLATFVGEPDAQAEPGMIESNVVGEALLFFACILSELEVAAKMPKSADLRALWAMLYELDEHAKDFVDLRYRRLLRLPLAARSSVQSPKRR